MTNTSLLVGARRAIGGSMTKQEIDAVTQALDLVDAAHELLAAVQKGAITPQEAWDGWVAEEQAAEEATP